MPPPLKKICWRNQAKFFCLLFTMSPTIIRKGCIQMLLKRSMKQTAKAAKTIAAIEP